MVVKITSLEGNSRQKKALWHVEGLGLGPRDRISGVTRLDYTTVIVLVDELSVNNL